MGLLTIPDVRMTVLARGARRRWWCRLREHTWEAGRLGEVTMLACARCHRMLAMSPAVSQPPVDVRLLVAEFIAARVSASEVDRKAAAMALLYRVTPQEMLEALGFCAFSLALSVSQGDLVAVAAAAERMRGLACEPGLVAEFEAGVEEWLAALCAEESGS